jgi:hypothetical protein
MRKIPQGAGLYLAVLELVFALGWTVYVIYLPRLAASAAAALGCTGAEGKITGVLFSALALATFARMTMNASAGSTTCRSRRCCIGRQSLFPMRP